METGCRKRKRKDGMVWLVVYGSNFSAQSLGWMQVYVSAIRLLYRLSSSWNPKSGVQVESRQHSYRLRWDQTIVGAGTEEQGAEVGKLKCDG